MTLEEVQAALDRAQALIPGEDKEPWVEQQAYADDASSAVAYTLRALLANEHKEAEWVARRAYDGVDHYVTHRLGIRGKDRILRHPVVQAELVRPRRDLDELRISGDKPRELFTRLRERVAADAAIFFGTDEKCSQ